MRARKSTNFRVWSHTCVPIPRLTSCVLWMRLGQGSHKRYIKKASSWFPSPNAHHKKGHSIFRSDPFSSMPHFHRSPSLCLISRWERTRSINLEHLAR